MHGVQPTANAAPTRLAPARVVGLRTCGIRSVCIMPSWGSATIATPMTISRTPATRFSVSWSWVNE